MAESLRQIQNDRDWENVVLPRERHERLARLWLDVGRIHHRQLRARQPARGHEMQRREGSVCRRLVILVV